MRAFEFTTDAKSGKTIKLALFSDIHYDSPDCDRETLKKHLDFCVKDGRYILFGGDLFDAILLKDMKRAVPHLLENTDAQLNKKLDDIYNFLKPYQKQILFMGRGNHEESIIKYNGLDVLSMLATMLNMGQEHKILVGNYANFLRFSAKDSSGKMCFFDIYQHHGCGGSAPQTKGMLDFQSIAKGVNVDLIWLAHKHNSLVDYSTPIMSVNTQGDVVLKNRQCIMTPSYQKGRTIDYQVNFGERMYSHTALSGFGEVNLRLEKAGKDIGNRNKRFIFIPDVKITTIPSITIGAVQTAKLLQKTR